MFAEILSSIFFVSTHPVEASAGPRDNVAATVPRQIFLESITEALKQMRQRGTDSRQMRSHNGVDGQ